MSKIKSYSGLVKNDDGNFRCEKCGKADKFRMVAHIDGTDWYGYTYNCECGNVASVQCQRDKKDMWWWED